MATELFKNSGQKGTWLPLNCSTRDVNQNLTDHKKNEMC